MEYPPQIQQHCPARQNAETQYNPQHRQQQRPRAHFNFLRGCLDEHRATHQPARHERNADGEVPVAINLTADADFVAADDGQQRFVDILAVERLGEIGILLVGDGHVVHHLPRAVDNRDIRAVLVVHLRRLPAEVLERHGILRAARKQRRAERVGAAAAGIQARQIRNLARLRPQVLLPNCRLAAGERIQSQPRQHACQQHNYRHNHRHNPTKHISNASYYLRYFQIEFAFMQRDFASAEATKGHENRRMSAVAL